MTLELAMRRQYSNCSEIYGYQAFSAGMLPQEFVATAKLYLDLGHASFQLDRKHITGAIEAASSAEHLTLLWVMFIAAGGMLKPCGVVVVIAGKHVLPARSEIVF